MYGKRYFRLLVAVAIFFIVVVMMINSSEYPLTDLYPQQAGSNKNIDSMLATASKDSSSSGFFSFFIPSFLRGGSSKLKNSKLKHQNFYDVVNAFPLNSSLIDDKKYHKSELTIYTDPANLVKEKSTDFEFIKQDMCRDLKFTGDFKISDQAYLEADFNSIKNALKENPDYEKIIEIAKTRFKPTIPEEKQWFRFGGSSVWLPQYNLHYMVSRVLYSPSGIPNKSFVSFLYIQLFDKEWKELPPMQLQIPYVSNLVENRLNLDGSVNQNILDKTVSYREVKYPSFLPIPIEYLTQTENGKYYYGPEDPRMLTRTNPLGFDEPLIVFNMKSVKLVKRVMHRYLPFAHDLAVLKKRNEPWANIEKNWTPFISSTNSSASAKSFVNFIYSIDPLEILTCEIDTGICDFLQKPIKDDLNYIGPLRGGSQLVNIPFDEVIPKHILDKFELPKNRQVYVGWARAHLNKCGCGESMYRPNLIVLVEDYNPDTQKFYYKLGDVSEYFDFDSYVPPWTTPKLNDKGELIEEKEPPKQCTGRNVLIPNSIAYWSIESIVQDRVSYPRKYFHKIPTFEQLDDKKAMKVTKVEPGHLKKRTTDYPVYFNDYMGVTLSAADSDVSIVHLKGFLNYILNLPSLYDPSTQVLDDSLFQPRGYTFNNECAMDGSHDYCIRYAEANGGVTEYPPPVETDKNGKNKDQKDQSKDQKQN